MKELQEGIVKVVEEEKQILNHLSSDEWEGVGMREGLRFENKPKGNQIGFE